jgi:XTP/dITP diphosphohydrolase
LVFATHNSNKLQEIRSMLPEGYELLSLQQIGCMADPPETHETIAENAVEKAGFVFSNFGYPCFADDSGLEVDALGGRPGVRSARYAGEQKDPEKNIEKLLFEMKHITNRKAQFRTVIAFAGDEIRTFEGIIKGEILKLRQGKGGFGYDPVFKPEGFDVSFAEMPLTEKNRISHRAKAFSLLINYLNELPGLDHKGFTHSGTR